MRTLNEYCRQAFGEKLYKLSLNGGMTCPNRDGTLDTRGCIFCSAGGSGDFAPDARLSIPAQIEEAKARVAQKYRGRRYIAYFQAYTNTYAPVERLRDLFTPVIQREDIAVLSVATRPDCLPGDVLDLLGELNRKKPVWVELGLQTIHPATAAYIRRGYDLACYDRAVAELTARGIHVVTHVILYLPGETREQMLETVRYVGRCSGGIKLQLLHVLEGTDLAAEYRAGRVPLPTLEEYVDLVRDCVGELPPDTVVHRMTGDGPKRILIAPQWSGDKKRVLNALNRALGRT
ncbi:MAG: TIGR01212 family radical SAM protein [Candidatus Onthomonas sp.]|nr:TIGR01212 family radical SAM protein [Candidatus Onthomonas sp.]